MRTFPDLDQVRRAAKSVQMQRATEAVRNRSVDRTVQSETQDEFERRVTKAITVAANEGHYSTEIATARFDNVLLKKIAARLIDEGFTSAVRTIQSEPKITALWVSWIDSRGDESRIDG